ncbi:hypothetical protein NDU88_003705 [Pleurodeles waltl]|uniref:Uncharacterized protein n=1 Tax=Pleurodeles waltl TaxID=8319 RepID=A0AAV7V0S0_PLEWA|nr:hypothetical protein NDU88_003705 [Pleurodeles waltl]
MYGEQLLALNIQNFQTSRKLTQRLYFARILRCGASEARRHDRISGRHQCRTAELQSSGDSVAYLEVYLETRPRHARVTGSQCRAGIAEAQ